MEESHLAAESTRPVTLHLILTLLMLSALLLPVISSSSVNYSGSFQEHRSSAHSYSNSLSSAYDGSNSSYAFIVVRGCDSGSCTQQSYYDVDYTLSPVSSPDSLEFEWNIQPYDSFTPANSITNISLFSSNSQTWDVKVSELGTISGWELVNIDITSEYIQPSGDIELRVSGYHEDTGEQFSDELGIWIREFHLYSDVSEPLDTDQDGIIDTLDACPNGDAGWTSSSITDHDSDGCQDSGEDADDDNDGVSDSLDNCSKGQIDWSADSSNDNDSDGCQDSGEDADDDNDGVEDLEDVFPLNALEWSDFDEDAIGDNADTDDDNDGVEDTLDVFPFDNSESSDFDGDTVGDNADLDDDDDGVEDSSDLFPFDDTEWSDFDMDDIGDNADLDDDNDGVDDTIDVFPFDNSESSDFDGDTIGDNADLDDDNDGVEDDNDSFPFDDLEWSDFDGDAVGDNADLDDDNDGYSDVDENASGSNPQDSSVIPNDWDDDWLSDIFDDDDDNDGILDDDDDCNREIGKNWGERETDTTYSHNSALDYDMDGCRDVDEDDDDDNDERNDTQDECPVDGELNWDSKDSNLDFDEDGCRDDKPEDDNDDNDAWADVDEEACNTNPRDASSYPSDVDGDGICDLIDQFNGTGVETETTKEQNDDDCTAPKFIPDILCPIVEPYEEYVALCILAPISIIGFIIALGNYRSNILQDKRLDIGSERFGKGDRRFDYIEREMDELEEQIEER